MKHMIYEFKLEFSLPSMQSQILTGFNLSFESSINDAMCNSQEVFPTLWIDDLLITCIQNAEKKRVRFAYDRGISWVKWLLGGRFEEVDEG
jgi:hypothetical protein